jgi:hypothetical protein
MSGTHARLQFSCGIVVLQYCKHGGKVFNVNFVSTPQKGYTIGTHVCNRIKLF